MPRFVVRADRPWRRRLLVLLFLAVVGVVAVSAFFLGQYGLRQAFDRALAERQLVAQVNAKLVTDNKALSQRVAALQRGMQVDLDARQRVRGDLESLGAQVRGLKEELAFYKGIALGGGNDMGLRIGTLSVAPDGEPKRYRYRLVLTRVLKNAKVVTGTMGLSVAGVEDGRNRTASLAELGQPRTNDIPFRLRHFKIVEGLLELPTEFLPREITVRVRTQGARSETIERSFDWATLVSVG